MCFIFMYCYCIVKRERYCIYINNKLSFLIVIIKTNIFILNYCSYKFTSYIFFIIIGNSFLIELSSTKLDAHEYAIK